MTNSLKKITLLSIVILGLQAATIASEIYSDSSKFYIGLEGGYSKPIKKKFTHLESGSVGNLEGSKSYEGKIGHKFYENMAVELSYAYRPDYKLHLDIPDKSFYSNMGSKTKVSSEVIMMNLVYFAQTDNRVTPYFSAGIGYARVTPKVATIYGDIKAMGLEHKEVGNVIKHKSERIAYRLGTGVNIAMNNSLALTLGGKIEVINNIALHTRFIDVATKTEIERKSIKKTIGVAEITAGLRYSF